MAAAAALARDRRHVDLVAARAQRDAPRRPLVAGRLADQRHHLGAFDGAQGVDDPLGVRLLRADLGEVVAEEIRDDDPAALVELGALERAGEQLQLRELHRLVDVAEDVVHVGAGLDELGREPQRLRRRVRVLEAAGVGDETDVERLGDLRRERNVERAEDVADDLGGRRRLVDDQVDAAEAVVVVMVIDVEHQAGALDRLGVGADAALVRAVDGEEHALFESVGSSRRTSARAAGSGTRPAAARRRSGT